jgi:hypothetical protein
MRVFMQEEQQTPKHAIRATLQLSLLGTSAEERTRRKIPENAV